MTADLIELVRNLGQPRVLVVGDLMLDRYVWGDAGRISQEAPVILLQADRREERLGGASSVASLLRALGARVTVAGVVGSDHDGARIRQLLSDLDIDPTAVVADPARPTTVKERYIGRAQHRHPQQMIRVDYEDRSPLNEEMSQELIKTLNGHMRKSDIVLISDYDKGVCTPKILQTAIDTAKSSNVRILADPMRGSDYSKYRGCTCITPNRLEAGIATGYELDHRDQVMRAATELQQQLDLEAAIVTLDKDGMAFVHRDGRRHVFPTRPRQVYDITGAGDMVLSMLGMALAAGADFDQAIPLANIAGGLEVERIGVATITRDEILQDLLHESHLVAERQYHEKLLPLDVLQREIDYRRRLGQRIAFTNGCFDVLHAGHVQYLEEARAQADLLIVGLNSDESIRQLKGEGRPIQAADARARVLGGLRAVDYLTVFQESTPIRLIETLRPDVLVKGSDYAIDEVVGAEFVQSYGGRVHLAAFRDGFSTTKLIDKLRAA